VHVFGGRFAGAGATLSSVSHKSSFETRRVIKKNGLRPVWNETAVVLTSHPELTILHVEVRDRSTFANAVAAYAALPLSAMRAGKRRVLALHDPHEKSTGPRVIFSKLVVGVVRSRIVVPEHVDPVIACLGNRFTPAVAHTYRQRIEAEGMQLADLRLLPEQQLMQKLDMPAQHAATFSNALNEAESLIGQSSPDAFERPSFAFAPNSTPWAPRQSDKRASNPRAACNFARNSECTAPTAARAITNIRGVATGGVGGFSDALLATASSAFDYLVYTPAKEVTKVVWEASGGSCEPVNEASGSCEPVREAEEWAE
jgi:hypothetical protein